MWSSGEDSTPAKSRGAEGWEARVPVTPSSRSATSASETPDAVRDRRRQAAAAEARRLARMSALAEDSLVRDALLQHDLARDERKAAEQKKRKKKRPRPDARYKYSPRQRHMRR